VPEAGKLSTQLRLVALAAVAGIVVVACAPADDVPKVPVARGGEFITSVVDSLYDAGRSPSVVLDEEGNPTAAYILVQPVLRGDELPPAIIPGDPQPPAVVLATGASGVWTRTSVTPQNTTPATGEAPELANRNKQAKPGVGLSMAVDGQGLNHLAWSTPNGLFYTSGDAGGFAEPVRVAELGTLGASIAVAGDGTPWISFYQGDTAYAPQASARVMPTSVKAATKEGDSWRVEDVAPVTGCQDCPLTRAAIATGQGDEPMVAFTDPDVGTPMLARRSAGSWAVEEVEPEGGGFGLAMDVDGDGNPHLAYYTAEGAVRHARSIGGGPWEAETVSESTSAGATPEETLGWGAGIALDDEGIVYVAYSDAEAGQIMLAVREEAGFRSEAIPGGEDGWTPAVAVAPDASSIAVAWFDALDRDLNIATRAAEEVPLAFSPTPQIGPSGTADGGATTAPQEAECQPEGSTVTVAAQNLAFDKDCLAAPAGEPFTILFQNNDPGVPHNVTVYADDSATTRLAGSEGVADVITGPSEVTYDADPLEGGVFYFQCDVHPFMNGQFAVV
jgi:plastocyanin